MSTEVDCPVDFITVNENKVRLTAFSILLLVIVFIFLPNWIIPAFLSVDFFLRGFNFGKYSLLNIISDKEVQLFSVKIKPIDQAPKRFAAKIGFIFSISILAVTLLQYPTAATILAVVLAVFAFLESVVGFCAGCYVYSFYTKLFGIKKKRAVN